VLALLHFSRARHQLLELAFNIRIAHVLVFKHSIGIDGERSRGFLRPRPALVFQDFVQQAAQRNGARLAGAHGCAALG
jgi:hypothetical protein